MDRNTLGHSILLEESKEPIKQMKGKQEDSFAGTAKNDHVDHSEKNVPKDLEALARATKNVPEDVEITEIKSNDLDNKTGRNIGKRNRQDDSGSKTKFTNLLVRNLVWKLNLLMHKFVALNTNVILCELTLICTGTSSSVKGRTIELTPAVIGGFDLLRISVSAKVSEYCAIVAGVCDFLRIGVFADVFEYAISVDTLRC
uniref:Uncharacterized protein n=1 Tax=Oryza sativa subsp. japonica TaxID=39947 RepID=Q6H4B7_ORYSJ|nr:hypothetical protein [Oryza sativa Japonica Group]BAD26432.1 hypothetical protein [Oryza sativa Japonica Group]